MSGKTRKFRLLKIILIVVLAAVIGVYVLMPVGMGFFTTLRSARQVGSAPEGFTEVTLQTADTVALAAWYLPAQNGASIILLHGSGGSRESVRSLAQMLAKNGYGVLAFDMRGHMSSGGDGVNAYNWGGTEDVGAAVDFLQKQESTKAIGGLGVSLGGEVLLGAASQYPQLKAVISDGATYRTLGDYLALPSRRPIVRSFTTRLMFGAAQLFGGVKPPVKLIDSIAQAKETSFLFIAAGNVERESEYGALFEQAAGGRSQLWVVDGVGHTGAYAKDPAEYEQRVTSFFDETLIQ